MSIASVTHTHVFGIKQEVKHSLFSVDDDTILYPAGSNVVVLQNGVAKFIPLSEKGEAITALSVSHDRHLLAIAERNVKPSISVYDITSSRKRRTLLAAPDGSTARDFTSIAFSSDSKYLVAQLGAPDWTLHYYAWDKGKLIATIKSAEPNQKILQVSVNPSDGTLLFTVGETKCRMFRYSEGELRSIDLNLPDVVRIGSNKRLEF